MKPANVPLRHARWSRNVATLSGNAPRSSFVPMLDDDGEPIAERDLEGNVANDLDDGASDGLIAESVITGLHLRRHRQSDDVFDWAEAQAEADSLLMSDEFADWR